MHIRAGLHRLASTRLAGEIIRLGFAYMSFVIPVHRLRETNTLIAFQHPSPSYPVHILLVPKRGYRSLADIPPEDMELLQDLLATVQSLVRELGLAEQGYRLIANGGAYQDVPVLHFHLISGAG